MALRIDDYFDEDERPAEERDDEAQPAQPEAQAAPAVPEAVSYTHLIVVVDPLPFSAVHPDSLRI